MSLTDKILSRARELGFDNAGIAPAAPLPHGDEFRRWLDADMHGQLHYMERSRHHRDKPTSLSPGARSIISLTSNYNNGDALQGRQGKIARYARGFDYHKILETRLDRLAAFIRMESGVDVKTRASVDRLPLMERDVAFVAGLGWYGKNTMIMNRSQGSYFFLSELLVDLDLEPNTTPPAEFCGSCTACLDACPTQAFVAPWVLDARRCISYLTIELRGPIPRDLRPLIGDHLFGCDICQSVCPWNRKAPKTKDFPFLGRPDVTDVTAYELINMDEATFRQRLIMSPLQRTQRPGLLRNAAVVLGNSENRRWITTLDHNLSREPEALIRGHIAWAMGRLGGRRARIMLDRHAQREQDPYVLEELHAALEEV